MDKDSTGTGTDVVEPGGANNQATFMVIVTATGATLRRQPVDDWGGVGGIAEAGPARTRKLTE